ncbi:MAG: FGGY-family carbohydrate kinase [Eubacteriales bacterium]|nr:FGGY-family carbohydrate kinase [Eubacteriales bacterium]
MKIAGLDIGTTGCKCTVFDRSGNYLEKAYRDYPVSRSVSGHEVDVSVIMDAVYAVLSEMAAKYPDIAGIGVTSFGETFVAADGEGRPLCPAMLYTDPRGKEECQELVRKLGGKKIAEITGLRPHEMYSIAKLMWLRQNRPEVYARADCIFLMEDYVVYHLTGNCQIDYSLASRTMAFDIRKLEWSREIFDAAGVDPDRMSETVPPGTDAGVIREDAAKRTGLDGKTRVVSISHDQIAAAVGAGIFDSSEAADGAGTVECITPVFDSLPDMDVMYDGYFAVVPYVIPGKYAAYAFSYTGGALIQWCADTIAKKEKEWAKEDGESVNSYLEKRSASPTGLLVLPHFAGAATPYMDTGSEGAILGLTTATTAADIYRGCMEGVVYEMLCNLKALEGSGCRFTRLRATGGGARSEEWMQMKADILNLPITALETADAGTVGSAMMTGIALGIFRDLEEAAERMIERRETYLPRREMHGRYMKIYQRYERLYQTVRPLMEKEAG